MDIISLDKWREEAVRRFGKNPDNWGFVCPACGHIATVGEFRALGANPNQALQECIGRVNGKGADGMKGLDVGFGCNWAAYGLFRTLGKGIIVKPEDEKTVEVFDFAPATIKEAPGDEKIF